LSIVLVWLTGSRILRLDFRSWCHRFGRDGFAAMHIPDNYLSPSTCAVLATAMLPVWTTAAKKVKKEITNTKTPLLGIGAAFAFLIMMFNVPLP